MINQFIKKTFLFSLIAVFIILILFKGTNVIIKNNAKFYLKNKNKTILLVGHSHAECAFNDTIITNLNNFGASGEAYFWTYQKVKQLIKFNPQIKTVLVEFSNNQIEHERDNWIWGNENISARLLTYYPFMEFEDTKLLYSKNKSSFTKALSKTFRENLRKIIINDYDYSKKIGGFLWLERNKTDSLIINQKKNKIKNHNVGVSIKNIEYLEKIVSFCNKKNINIYFIRAPQHQFSEGRRYEKQFNKIRMKYFKNIEFLDFNDYPLSNEEFGDFDHLNHRGANVFSLWFNSLLKKGMLSKKDKNRFVLNEINQYNDSLSGYKISPIYEN